MRRASYVTAWLVVAMTGGAAFLFSVFLSKGMKHPGVESEISVALPPPVEVALTGGDRYLAANIGAVRSQVTDPAKMAAGDFKVLAAVQKNVSFLNPRHEDNYYSAAAILSWYGQLEAAQTILKSASQTRPFDYQPTLYYGFNLLYFYKDPLGASDWLRQAAPALPTEKLRLTMADLAARWLGKSEDLQMAIQMTKEMARQARRDDFKSYLEKRAERLQGLLILRSAEKIYRERTGTRLARLGQLTESKLLKRLPVDPFGAGFTLNAEGIPIVVGDAG